MIKKNEVFKKVTITDYTHLGYGVTKINKVPIFVKYAKLGEVYDIKIVKVEKKFSYAIAINNKLNVTCPHFQKCGGCHILHLRYDEQLAFKENVVKNLVTKEGIDTQVNTIIKSEEPLNYRNKIMMPFALDENKDIYLGFYQEKSHVVEKINYCYLQSDLVNEIVKEITRLVNEVKEEVYDEDIHKGNLRHIYIRESKNTNEVMVCFVLNSDKLKNHQYIVKELTMKFKEIKAIVINENTRRTSAVLGFKNYNIYNCNFISEKLNDVEYRLLPNAFFQVNTNQAIKMYDKIKEYSTLDKEEVVLDAFCGTGSIGLYIANDVKEVVGIEINNDAIKCAIKNSQINNIKNATFICNDIEKEIIKYNDQDFFDLVIIDPPRSGIEKNFIEILLKQKVKKIIYVSCNPGTLIRDLKLLNQEYNCSEITPIDMFSQTYHIEAIAKLELK